MAEGNGELAMRAGMRVNRGVARSYRVACGSSNTLQTRDREHSGALRARAIEATVQAIATGSVPRLGGTLAPV